MGSLFETTHNPDVLSCIANLSNDEVFTPPELVNQMLDMLPSELWSDPQATFLDPACKSGVFLREIAKRLIKGLEDEFPDLEERLEHIYKKQLFGIAITELTSLLSRRSLYCSKWPNSVYSIVQFDNPKGNIDYVKLEHSWEGGRCRFCGAAEREYKREEGLEQYAYEFIHLDNPEEVLPVKFDVIIGNPPYQMSTGGGDKGGQAKAIYPAFVEQAKRLNPRYLVMIIPARWFAGGMGLGGFRNDMLNDRRIRRLCDFEDSKACFSGVDIAGGVCYFLWDRDHEGDCVVESNFAGQTFVSERYMNEHDVFVRNPIALSVVNKVLAKAKDTLDKHASSQQPFGLKSNVEFIDDGDIDLRSRNGWGKYARALISKNPQWIDKYKVITSKTAAEHAGMADKNGFKKILSVIEVMGPGSVCSESYRVMGCFEDKRSADNMSAFLKTRFVRFLVSARALSQNLSTDSFSFVPYEDFSQTWNDEKLYKKYALTEQEIFFIESTIKPIDLGGESDE